MKSSVEQIRTRFDNDVARFANLETGQSATVDAPLVLELIARCAAATNPQASSLLDIGCGAGNYSLKLLQHLPGLDVTLVDLSRPMLDRALQRVGMATRGRVRAVQGDIRDMELGEGKYAVMVAAAVFHHLRTDDEWRAVFQKCYTALKPDGSLWMADLISHDSPLIQAVMGAKYGEYLTEFKGEAYRDTVFSYIEAEDTPRSLLFQTDLLRQVGFRQVEILHKNSCFAAFGAIK
jgi:tRNA (cmo5U34)-methyltransferase